jgi:2-polyprenyl-6-methoxyphenol hydroxylase-like FAD-dependent oxidoreductase
LRPGFTQGAVVRVIIIGSGIAGLSAAIALRKVGIDTVVYERAPELREVGAGISLWANALRALDYIGVGESVRAVSLKMVRSEMRARNGHKVQMGLDSAKLEARFGLNELVRMIHRADLVGALAAHLPPGTAHYGHECVGVENFESKPRVRFANGHTDEADAVIGADGIRSVVRSVILGPEEPRYSGYTCWRGVAPRPAGIEPGYIGEWWGRGKRLGITTIPGDRVYWFVVENAPPNGHAPDEKAHLLDTFADWADPGPAMLAATPADHIFRNDIIDRPPVRTWVKGRVGIIGDAAHPTTPNLGQGGCMAIEDSVVLARQFANNADPTHALEAFAAERFARTAAIVRESWKFGRLAQKEGKLTCWLRDTAIGLFAKVMSPAGFLKYARFDVGLLNK